MESWEGKPASCLTRLILSLVILLPIKKSKSPNGKKKPNKPKKITKRIEEVETGVLH